GRGGLMAPVKPTPRVLIADELSPRALEIFRERGVAADFRPGLPPAELEGTIADYDGLAVRSATKVTAALLAKARRLKVVRRPGARPAHEGDRLRSLPVGGSRPRPQRAEGRACGAARPRRLRHPAHAAHRRDPQPDRRRGAGQGQARPPADQLRARRAGGRG